MKYKIAGILACAVILFIALIPTPDSLDGSESPRVHQHLQAKAQQESGRDTAAECSHGDDVLCTHLPLVVIDISDDEIPFTLSSNSTFLGKSPPTRVGIL